MRSLVVYDSVFGNTEELARAMAGVLASAGEVAMKRAEEASAADLDGVELLVVGSPTRAFRPTPATMSFIKELAPDALRGVRVAAFDTRIDVEKINKRFLSFMVKSFGYAAKPIATALQRKGGSRAAEPAGFLVGDKEGPLIDGERERAVEWARALIEG